MSAYLIIAFLFPILYAKDSKNFKTQAEEAKAAGDEKKAKELLEEGKKFIQAKEDEYNNLFCTPYNAARYGYIDDVIEPRNTRFRVIRALEVLRTKKLTNPAKKHGNIPL